MFCCFIFETLLFSLFLFFAKISIFAYIGNVATQSKWIFRFRVKFLRIRNSCRMHIMFISNAERQKNIFLELLRVSNKFSISAVDTLDSRGKQCIQSFISLYDTHTSSAVSVAFSIICGIKKDVAGINCILFSFWLLSSCFAVLAFLLLV